MELELIARVAAPTFTIIIGFILRKYFQDRPRLITYLVHATAIPLRDEKDTFVNTHSIVVRNSGNRTAHNVRIGHNVLPKSYQLYPQLNHKVISDREMGPAEILIPTLVPKEQVTISYLYFPPDTWNQIHSYIKSDEVGASGVEVIPAPVLTRLQKWTLLFLIFVGASTLVYWAIVFGWPWVSNDV